VANESLTQHNVRLMAALTATQFRPWPCVGPVVIKETHREHGWEQVHLFDQWHYVGSAKCESELHELSCTRRTPVFDADIYKLLIRYFDKGGRYTPMALLSATETIEAIDA
jgi:DNA polymerase III subunit epsilon